MKRGAGRLGGILLGASLVGGLLAAPGPLAGQAHRQAHDQAQGQAHVQNGTHDRLYVAIQGRPGWPSST